MNKLFLYLLTVPLFLFLGQPSIGIAQPNHKHGEYKKLSDVPQSTWDKLAQQRIFFGHHSVGENILEGVSSILTRHPNIKLRIRHADKSETSITHAGLVEGGVGQNFHPLTKLNAFKEKVEAGYGQTADIAFFKFCFVDFSPETDIHGLFTEYKKTMKTLKKEYPNTIFPVVTAPLTCYAPGINGLIKRTKDFIKKIIGKVNMYDFSSANRFNELLIGEYGGKNPIFDLAKYESTKTDGTRVVKEKNGIKNYELAQEYTTDGGHLNTKGKQMIGKHFLLFLAELAENKP